MEVNTENRTGRLIIVLGPTASGKTALAVRLAKLLGTEVISADSRQFYREMRIGTARPTEQELAGVPHHFLGHLSIFDAYNAASYEEDVIRLLEELFTRYDDVIMAGGSGLYIDAVCKGIDELPDPDPGIRKDLDREYRRNGLLYLQEKLRELDPGYYEQVDLSNPKRVLRAIEVSLATGKPYSSLRKGIPKVRKFTVLKIGLRIPIEQLEEIISRRVDRMMELGLLEEVRQLYPNREENALNTVGYKEFFEYFDGRISLQEAKEKIRINTRKYAKRQMTWFKKDPDICWFSPDEVEGIMELISQDQEPDMPE